MALSPVTAPKVGVLIGGKHWPWHDLATRELEHDGVAAVWKTGEGDWGHDPNQAGLSGALLAQAEALVKEGCVAIIAGDSQSTVAASRAVEQSSYGKDIPVFAVIGFLTKIRTMFESVAKGTEIDPYVNRIVGFFGEHSVRSGDKGDWDGLSMLVGFLTANGWRAEDIGPVALLYNSESSSSMSELHDLSHTSDHLCVRDRIRLVEGLENLDVDWENYGVAGNSENWADVIKRARKDGCKSLVVIEDPVFGMQFDNVMQEICAKAFRPTLPEEMPFPSCFETKIAADAGALMSYGWDRIGSWLAAARIVGTYVARGQIAELFAFGKQAHKQNLFINQWAAAQLGLSVPIQVRVPQPGPENFVPVEDLGWQFRVMVPEELRRPWPRLR
jgi:hypothetical protein